MNNLLSQAEIVTGLILDGKQSVTMFNPERFPTQYARVITDLKKGLSREEILVKYPETLIQPALQAAHSVNGLGREADWVSIMDMAYKNELIEESLDKAKRFAQSGDTDKLDKVLQDIKSIRNSTMRLNSILASEISDEYEAYIPSGSKALDKQVGGIPNTGLVVVGAKTFTGKTTFAISLMEKFLNEYPNKKILFVTLEDMNEGWKFRTKQILGERDKSFWDRIRVMEFSENANSIIEEASRHPDVGMIIVDYLEYLTKESDVSTYTEVYKTLSTGAKTLAVSNAFRSMPIFLLAQFGKTLYKGGVPTPEALPYVDQRFVYMQIMLYTPEGDTYSDNEENAYTLPTTPKKGYIIFWKTKNAKPHDPDFPGAICVNHSAKFGYDLSNTGEWFSLSASTKREVKKKKV